MPRSDASSIARRGRWPHGSTLPFSGCAGASGDSAMECDALRERLQAYVDGELESAEAGTIRRHLEACPSCRRERAALLEMRSAARELLRSEAPEELKAELLAQARGITASTPSASTEAEWPPSGAPSILDRFATWVPGRWLRPALGAAALVLLAWIVQDMTLDRLEQEAVPAFERPAPVIVLRFGDTSDHSVEPPRSGLVLPDPI
ncbi:MAG: hypothetical protein GF355_16070 [Candidatus Eisenbacteria bacterium]|nr:hypothetical protein [Candidatus Eisenbacteria bacterium]